MPRNSSGIYTLPSGNPVVSGTLIEAGWANTTLSDLGSAMTNSLSRGGEGGMTAALRVVDGTLSVPGIAFVNETSSGLYRAGAGDFRLSVLGTAVAQFLSTGVSVTGTLGVSGATTLTGALTLNGGIANNPVLTAGTANGVTYLNGSKVLTSGTALTFDGTNLGTTGGVSAVNLSYTGTLTGGTGVVNLGSGQVYKDASGNVGIGTSSPAGKLQLGGTNSVLISGEGTGDRSFGTNVFSTLSPPSISLMYQTDGSTYKNYSGLGMDFTDGVLGIVSNYQYTGGGKIAFYTGDKTSSGGTLTERMRIDSSGNLGIGMTPTNFGNGYTVLQVANASNGGMLYLTNTANAGGRIYGNGAGLTYDAFSTTYHAFNTNGSERARIDSSGNLLVGTTSQIYGTSRLVIVGSGANASIVTKPGADNYNPGIWLNAANSPVGSIFCSSTATNYGTSSDYRLKEAIAPMTGALARNALLNPVFYKWKVDGSEGEGFVAHELQGPFPSAVTGEKDAVDADGKPIYQGIGTGPLDGHFAACVNELTQLIREQQTLITALTARITALEQA